MIIIIDIVIGLILVFNIFHKWISNKIDNCFLLDMIGYIFTAFIFNMFIFNAPDSFMEDVWTILMMIAFCIFGIVTGKEDDDT